jgi:hypothetical protein
MKKKDDHVDLVLETTGIYDLPSAKMSDAELAEHIEKLALGMEKCVAIYAYILRAPSLSIFADRLDAYARDIVSYRNILENTEEALEEMYNSVSFQNRYGLLENDLIREIVQSNLSEIEASVAPWWDESITEVKDADGDNALYYNYEDLDEDFYAQERDFYITAYETLCRA